MTEPSYLTEKLDHFDADFQLTSRFIESPERERIAAVHGLRAEYRDLLTTITDPGVALARLAWWHEELQRFTGGEPRHPVTRSLARAGVGLPESMSGCLAALAGLIEATAWESVDSMIDTVRRLSNPFAEMECSGNASIAGLWQDIQLRAMLDDLPTWWRLGRLCLPLDVSAARQIDRQGLASDLDIAAKALGGLVVAVSDRLAEPSTEPLHAAIYHDLCCARIRALGHARVAGGGIRSGPGPMRRLLLAWRAARRIRRGSP